MKKMLAVLIAFSLLFSKDLYKQIRIYNDDMETLGKLRENGLDIDHIYVEKGLWLEFVLSENKIPLLNATNLHYDIIYEDIEQYYLSRLDNEYISRDFELGSMGGYYTFAEIEEQLDRYSEQFPELVTQKVSIGTTLEGRNIWMIKVSDNPNIDENEPEMLYTGLHHAREPMSYMNLFYFINWLTENYGIDSEATALINNRELYFIPAINPDGLVYNQSIAPNGGGMQRKNMKETCSSSPDGVDLNRNYSYMWGYDNSGSSPDGCNETYRGALPFSEPETQAIKDFVEMHDFPIALNYHSYSNLLIYPLGYTYDNPVPQEDLEIFIEYGEQMVQYNGYALGTGPELLYTVNGEACDWMYGEKGIFAYTPEIGNSSDGFWPSTMRIIPLAEENLFPNKFVAWSVGENYEIDFSINDGPYSPGETYSTNVSIFNAGLGGSNGSIVLSINSADNYITFNTESIDVGTLDSRSVLELGDIFTFQVSPSAPNGIITGISISIKDDNNYEFITTIQIIIGEDTPLISENFEQQNNWTVGASDDNATAGIWELGIPEATFFDGNQAQAGSDHSETGDLCFLTGADTSPGSVGFDDVDGGKTTLYSPEYDLSSYNEVLISYWRWYTNNVGDNPNSDLWKVDISNDGWQTWTSLENTSQSQGEWIQKSFLITQLGIELTNQMQLRFIAEDIFNTGDTGSGGSIIEAAIDDFTISYFLDNTELIGDINQDGMLNVLDIVSLVSLVLEGDCINIADVNGDSSCNVLDVVLLVNNILR